MDLLNIKIKADTSGADRAVSALDKTTAAAGRTGQATAGLAQVFRTLAPVVGTVTGTYGVWNGAGMLEWDGVTYKPNSIISVDDVALQMGTAAAPLTITMPESADFGITPDMLASIEEHDYKGRPVTIYDAYFDPDTRALVHVEPLYAGYIDTIDHVRDGNGVRLVGHVETTALDNHRDGYRSASHADQQLISPGDMFFEHAAKVQFETFEITLG